MRRVHFHIWRVVLNVMYAMQMYVDRTVSGIIRDSRILHEIAYFLHIYFFLCE